MSVAALGALTEMAATAPRQDDAHSRITRQVQAKEAMVRSLLAGCGCMPRCVIISRAKGPQFLRRSGICCSRRVHEAQPTELLSPGPAPAQIFPPPMHWHCPPSECQHQRWHQLWRLLH